MRKLNKQERKEWAEFARTMDSDFSPYNLSQLEKLMEEAKSAVEKAEVICLVIEHRMRLLGDERYHNPMPSRKAVEAVRLAIPKFRAKVASL